MPRVTVLVAAYNNGKYIEELLRSLLAQTHRDMDIIVRDDGSSDDTLEIVKRLSENDSRISLLDSGGRGEPGVKTNFFTLLLNSDGDYTMFCDADDVWYPAKVEKTLKLMRGIEDKRANAPVLIHTDLAVADESLSIVGESLFKYEKLSPHRKGFKELLVQNNVTGCTVMINRPLKNLVAEIPEGAVMHDWWLALIASAFGEIGVLEEATLLYRQHGGNQIGAYKANSLNTLLSKAANVRHLREIYGAMYRQAGCFAETFKGQLSDQQYREATLYAEMAALSRPGKILRILRRGYFKNTFARNIGQFFAA